MFRKIIDNIEEIITIPMMVALLGILTWQIVSRGILDSPSLWSEELARVIFLHMAIIGAAIGIKKDEHVKIIFFSDKLPRNIRYSLLFTLEVLVLITIGAMIHYGYEYVQRNAFFELITLGISSSWMNYALPLGSSFMLIRQMQKLYFVQKAWRNTESSPVSTCNSIG
ncbi:TRAP transporter small permease [Psychromonas hadalis]|uniref:TRAP transporter small permease n=1 Tax=Psychromonas hadalis TaxID=211669 RepID=UPI0003B723B9|nr:TRAP transporter small permease [Psychromonas hadalis]